MMRLASMKKIAALVAGATLLSGAAVAETVRNDEFRLTFPNWCGGVQKQEQKVGTPSGDQLNVVTYKAAAENGAPCILSYSEFPGVITDPESTMDNGRDEFLRSLGIPAKIENQKDVKVNGQPGLSFRFSADQPRPIFGRTDLVVSGNRLYHLIFVGFSAEQRTEAESSEFFRSFFVEAPAAAAPRARAQAEATSAE